MTTNLEATIDALGKLKAQIADLQNREKALKEALAGLPAGAYDGELFRLTVSDVTTERLDMDAVRAKLSRQFIQANTIVTESRRLALKSRKAVTA